MTIAIEKFKAGGVNHRWHPFTEADMSIDKTEDHIPIPSSAPYLLQLLEVPRKDDPSSVVVYNYSDGITMTEVAHAVAPTQGEYAVDYPSPDGAGTGLVRFHSNDSGKDIRVTYKATGSPAVSEFLDAKVSWPAGLPGANQVVIFKEGVETWAYNPIRLFHSENVLYHPSGESKSCLLFRFKKGANESKVYLELMGAEVHQGYYTELAEHLHAYGTLGTGGSGTHAHSGLNHSHGPGSLSGTQPTHHHGYNFGPGQLTYTTINGDDAVTVNGGATADGAGGTGDAGDHGHNITGSTALAGGSPKTFPDSLHVFIDGTDRTAALLALSGLAKFGDGTETHGFVVSGTGDMEITPYVSATGYHLIKVTEPISAKGGKVLLCAELL
jgi:hypothetical protein